MVSVLCFIISKKENKYGKVLITVKARYKIWIFIILIYFPIHLNIFLVEKKMVLMSQASDYKLFL